MELSEDERARLKNVYTTFPSDRLKPYLDGSGGNPFAGLSLYDWNTRASGAMYETLGHVEVLVRNRLDAALVSRHTFKGRAGDWLDDGHGEFTEQASTAMAEARARASEGFAGREAPRGRTIAELNFGFWRRILDHRYESTHGSAVMRLFPSLKRATNNDMGNLRQLIEPLYSLRNRLAHLEPIWHLNLAARHDDAVQLISLIDSDTADWVDSKCRLAEILAERHN